MHAPDPHPPLTADRSRSAAGLSPMVQVLDEGSLFLSLDLPALRPGLVGLYGSGLHWAHPGGVLGLWVSPRGALVLRHRTGAANLQWESPTEFCGAGDRIRLSYQVWSALGHAVLRAENGTTGAATEVKLSPAQPLPLTAGWTDLPPEYSPHVEVAALPIPVRGLNGFGKGTHLPTLHGPFAVEQLLPGDAIQTPTGPVTIRDVRIETMTPVQRQEAISLQAPYFGLSQSLTVLADQRFLLGSVEVQALTGCAEILVAARDLVVGRAGAPDWTGRGDMVHLSFDQTLVLPLGGLTLVCPAAVTPWPEGARLPDVGSAPWASRDESRAVVEALARRKGILMARASGPHSLMDEAR